MEYLKMMVLEIQHGTGIHFSIYNTKQIYMMATRLLILIILMNLLSCAKSFHISPNKNDDVYKIIDTSSIYFLNSIDGDDFVVNSSLEKEYLNQKKRGIKFYQNGVIVRFNNINLKSIESFNPENGTVGLYNYENGILKIEFRYYHVQSGYSSIKSSANSIGDTLYIKPLKPTQENEKLDKYIKEPLDKNKLIFKPQL